MFVEGLVKLLANDHDVRALLGAARNDSTNGIFPEIAVESPTLPYLVYMQVHRETINSLQGVNRLAMLRFQISCYGNPYKSSKLLANAVKSVLDGFQGKLNDVDSIYIFNTLPISEHDETEPVFKATLYGVVLDYEFVTNG